MPPRQLLVDRRVRSRGGGSGEESAAGEKGVDAAGGEVESASAVLGQSADVLVMCMGAAGGDREGIGGAGGGEQQSKGNETEAEGLQR